MLQAKVIESYCVSLEALGRSERTIGTNKERLGAFQKFLAGRGINEIEKVNPELIDLYISLSYRKKLSEFTVAGRIQVIKSFFAWSVQRSYLDQSPATHLKKPHLNYRADSKAMLQEDLEAMILFARKTQNLMVEVMLMVFADTGCRSGELCGINASDVDFERKEILVSGKTGERLIDFTFNTAIKLGIYLDEKNSSSPNAPVFSDSRGKRINPRQVYARLRKIGLELGIKRFNPQAIRHRVGQGWLDQGANLEIVRQKLGHRDIQTTALFYSHQDRERIKRASQRFCLVKDV
jgi:site-specific recombinase XerD